MMITAALALLTVCTIAQSSGEAKPPKVVAPPATFFETIVSTRDREAAKKFYKKYIDVGGMPVVASEVVSDKALQRTYTIVTHLLAGRPDVIKAMVKQKMYLIIIGKDQVYTDMPEYRNSPNPDYMNERVRGTGGKPTSFGEENLLTLPIDRYDDESIGVHEFCHTIDSAMASIDAEWTKKRNAAFKSALAKGLWKLTYTGSNAAEFWAEACQSYFDCNRINNWNHGPIGNREELKAYDPETYELVRTAFNLSPEQDWRYTPVQKLPMVTEPPAKFKIDPFYKKFTWAREFTVVGRGASDEALLKANDTIRKMFAYRHDILKALIFDGVKLVVLGKGERVSDLPEFRNVRGVDLLSRTQDYLPETKTLVIPEEHLSGVVAVFARAVYRVTANRPVDPNWDKRGMDVQQYELRVKRLDIQFGERLAALAKRGSWKGTSAVNGPEALWTAGVWAYFNVPSADAAPNDAPHPISTRELLKEYDTELFALVDETMAYAGHVDWRYRQ